MRFEPTRIGNELLAALAQARPDDGVRIWPLGQSGILAQFNKATVLIDPYLSNHCEAVLHRPFDHRRMTRAPLDPSELTDIDVLICTHDHLDHLDPPTVRTLRDASPTCVLVLPRAATKTADDLDWPQDRVYGTKSGDAIHLAGLVITAFAVPHDDFDYDPGTDYPYQGYVISDGSISIGHVGDARSHPAVVTALYSLQPDVLCLPINGRDASRAAMGFAGNMNGSEAAELAHTVGEKHVIPMHFDMFAQNVDVDALDGFVRAAQQWPDMTVHAPVVGESIDIFGGAITDNLGAK